MTHANQSLADRVSELRDAGLVLTPEIVNAIRLAEIFDHIKPEEYVVPLSDGLDGFKPLNLNRMLTNAA